MQLSRKTLVLFVCEGESQTTEHIKQKITQNEELTDSKQ